MQYKGIDEPDSNECLNFIMSTDPEEPYSPQTAHACRIFVAAYFETLRDEEEQEDPALTYTMEEMYMIFYVFGVSRPEPMPAIKALSAVSQKSQDPKMLQSLLKSFQTGVNKVYMRLQAQSSPDDDRP